MKNMINTSWDPIWEKVFSDKPWGKYPSESLIRFIARNFYSSNRPEIKILEVGCGPGANIWYLSREHFNAYGIDGSPTAIQIANKRLSEEGLHANLIVGDIINLPFENNLFDAVIDVECICCNNIENTRIIHSEINRVLKPNGKFYCRTFTDKSYLGKTNIKISDNEYNEISDGPFSNVGFIRLTPKELIPVNFSDFSILTIDELISTQDNGEIEVSEWVVICEKK